MGKGTKITKAKASGSGSQDPAGFSTPPVTDSPATRLFGGNLSVPKKKRTSESPGVMKAIGGLTKIVERQCKITDAILADIKRLKKKAYPEDMATEAPAREAAGVQQEPAGECTMATMDELAKQVEMEVDHVPEVAKAQRAVSPDADLLQQPLATGPLEEKRAAVLSSLEAILATLGEGKDESAAALRTGLTKWFGQFVSGELVDRATSLKNACKAAPVANATDELIWGSPATNTDARSMTLDALVSQATGCANDAQCLDELLGKSRVGRAAERPEVFQKLVEDALRRLRNDLSEAVRLEEWPRAYSLLHQNRLIELEYHTKWLPLVQRLGHKKAMAFWNMRDSPLGGIPQEVWNMAQACASNGKFREIFQDLIPAEKLVAAKGGGAAAAAGASGSADADEHDGQRCGMCGKAGHTGMACKHLHAAIKGIAKDKKAKPQK